MKQIKHLKKKSWILGHKGWKVVTSNGYGSLTYPDVDC